MSKTTDWLIKEIDKERQKNIGLENRLKYLKGDLDEANCRYDKLMRIGPLSEEDDPPRCIECGGPIDADGGWLPRG